MSIPSSRRYSLTLLWVIFLAVAQLQTYAFQMHAHELDTPIDGTLLQHGDHGHAVSTHPSIDASHADHHDTVMFEIEAGPDRITANLSLIPAAAFVFVLITLLLFLGGYASCRSVARLDDEPLWRRRFHLTPALRAPPV